MPSMIQVFSRSGLTETDFRVTLPVMGTNVVLYFLQSFWQAAITACARRSGNLSRERSLCRHLPSLGFHHGCVERVAERRRL